MPHYCWVCKRSRANERFSGKGHRTHICKDCARRPKAERERIQHEDDIYAMMDQRNISEKNLARLRTLAASPDPWIAKIAGLVLEMGLVHPRKRKRLGFLAREHRELLDQLEEHFLTGVW